MKKINVVLTAEQACEIVLGLFDGVMRDGKPQRFVIQSCEPSANGHNGRLQPFATGNNRP